MGDSDWEIAVQITNQVMRNCFESGVAEEIDAAADVIHEVAYKVALLGGMSEDGAVQAQDLAVDRCHEQALYFGGKRG